MLVQLPAHQQQSATQGSRGPEPSGIPGTTIGPATFAEATAICGEKKIAVCTVVRSGTSSCSIPGASVNESHLVECVQYSTLCYKSVAALILRILGSCVPSSSNSETMLERH